MSVEQLESQIMALPLAERRGRPRWMDEHRDEIEPPSVRVKARETEIRQRPAEMAADPNLRCPMMEATGEQMFREFAHARAQTTPAPNR